MRREEADLPLTGADGALEAVHEPTVKVVQQLRQARLRLERAASPELRLSPAIRALWRTELRLDRPLRVAIFGEMNAGKSSLANLLAGIESLPTAVISNTRIPTLLYHASDAEIWVVDEGGTRERLHSGTMMPRRSIFRVEVGLPSPRLRGIQILDLPGLADPRLGDAAVDLAAHHVDAVIWCTMCTQAWKESERTVWSVLPKRLSSRGLLVATHRDLLPDPADRRKLLARLRQEVGTSFASIILMSTLEALAVMGKDHKGLSGAAWIASGAEALETALGALLFRLREQRAAAALRMTSRIAQRALARIDSAAGESEADRADPGVGQTQKAS
jgi:energy-coupling factor transporter ATP-binding protein EcfA2